MVTRSIRLARTGLTLFCALCGAALAAPPDLTITGAGVQQVSSDAVQFWMELQSAPVAKPSPNERTYIWFVDTDRNAATGQSHGPVGSEYNVRVVFGASAHLVGGWIDGIDGRPGSQGVPHIAGNRVTLRVRLAQLSGASSFKWNCGAFGEETGFASDNDRGFDAGWTPPEPGTPVRVVVEPAISLARGRTTATPKVTAWDADGKPVSLAGHTVSLFAMPAGAVTVSGGALQAIPLQAMPGVYSAAVDGIVSVNAGQVMVGSLDLVPPILHLSPVHNSIGQVILQAKDASGAQLPPEGHSVIYSVNGSGTIAMTSDGVITALPGGAGKGEWVWAELDGVRVPDTALVRVMSGDNTVPEAVEAAGQHVSIWYPPYGDDAPAELLFARAIADHSILQGLDRIYERQHDITGATPWTGGTQHVSLVCNDTQYSVCGGSGNTIQYGFQLSGPGCFLIGDSGVPHWGVTSHELAHNHFGELRYLNEVLCDWQNSTSKAIAYCEGLTTITALASRMAILNSPDHDGLPAIVTDAWMNPDVYDSIPFARRWYVDENLPQYMAKGANYTTDFDPNALDGMLMVLADDYGWGLFKRFFSIFNPPDDGMAFTADNETKRATFFVAAVSAAADADLRERFRDWGFPIDDAVFDVLLPEMQRRVAKPVPWSTLPDVINALRLAGGLMDAKGSGLDLSAGDQCPTPPDGVITVSDAIHAARAMAGLE